MKKHLNFRPSLTETTFDIKRRKDPVPGFTVTAPHPISSRLWDVMSQVDDFGVFDRQRDNDTQISFWINPGFDIDTLRSLLAPATYIATVYDYKTIISFWETGVEQHMTQYRNQIDFTGMVDPDLGRIVFSAWIMNRGSTILDNSFRDNVSHRGLYKNFVKEHLDDAYEALNRLIFIDMSKSPVSKEVLESRLKMVNSLIAELEKDQKFSDRLTVQTEALKAPARELWQALRQKMTGDAFASPELCAEFVAALVEFEAIGLKLDAICDSFDDDIVRHRLAEIKKLTPAEPSKK